MIGGPFTHTLTFERRTRRAAEEIHSLRALRSLSLIVYREHYQLIVAGSPI